MKKQILKSAFSIFLGSLLLFSTSCKKDKENGPGTDPGSTGGYVLAVRSEGGSDVSTDYLISADNLTSGEISIVGQGIEKTEYHFYQQTGKYITTVNYSDANVGTVYKLDEQRKLVEQGKFSVERLRLFAPVNDKQFIAIAYPGDASGAQGTIYVIDAEEANIVNQKAIDMYAPAKNGEQAVPTGAVVRGNKLYVPFFGIKTDEWDTEKTDSAYVAVYSYPELQFETLLRDGRTGPIGSYAGQGYIFNTENDDIYTVSSSAYGTGSYKVTKHSVILRIKAGQNQFDENYSMDVEAITGGYKLCNSYYIGNGKVLASIYSYNNQTEKEMWSRDNVKLAIIDLNAKSVNYISGVPVHNGGPTGMYNNHFILDNGKVYIKISNTEGIYIYEVDPNTYTGKKGAKLVGGKEVYGFFNLN